MRGISPSSTLVIKPVSINYSTQSAKAACPFLSSGANVRVICCLLFSRNLRPPENQQPQRRPRAQRTMTDYWKPLLGWADKKNIKLSILAFETSWRFVPLLFFYVLDDGFQKAGYDEASECRLVFPVAYRSGHSGPWCFRGLMWAQAGLRTSSGSLFAACARCNPCSIESLHKASVWNEDVAFFNAKWLFFCSISEKKLIEKKNKRHLLRCVKSVMSQKL